MDFDFLGYLENGAIVFKCPIFEKVISLLNGFRSIIELPPALKTCMITILKIYLDHLINFSSSFFMQKRGSLPPT